jgi:hypothetical protein
MNSFSKTTISAIILASGIFFVAQLQQSIDNPKIARANQPLILLNVTPTPEASTAVAKVTTIDTVIITALAKPHHTTSAVPKHKSCSNYGLYNHGIIDSTHKNTVKICN